MNRRQATILVQQLNDNAKRLNTTADPRATNFGTYFTAALVVGALAEAIMGAIKEGAFDE